MKIMETPYLDEMINELDGYIGNEKLAELKAIKEQLLFNGVKNILFDVNTILYTKDGRRIGNAIITGKDSEYNAIKTDYGNDLFLTDEEIKEFFYIDCSDSTEKNHMRDLLKKHKHYVKITV